MKTLFVLASTFFITASMAVFAQANLPQLSTADKVAIQALEKSKTDAASSYQDAQQKEASVLSEWAKGHPGFHLDPQTFMVLADPKPAPVKAEKPDTTEKK